LSPAALLAVLLLPLPRVTSKTVSAGMGVRGPFSLGSFSGLPCLNTHGQHHRLLLPKKEEEEEEEELEGGARVLPGLGIGQSLFG